MKSIKAKGILWMVLFLVPVLNGILLLTNGKKIQCKLWQVGGLITLLMQVGGFALSGVFSFFNDDLMTLFLLISIVGLIVPIILGLLKIGLYRKRTLLLSYAEQCNIQFTDFIELQGKYDTYLVEMKNKVELQRQEEEKAKREAEIRQREQEEQAKAAALKAQQEEAARREAEQRRLQAEANQREIEKQKQEQERKEAELRAQQEQAKREAELRKQQEQKEAELKKQQSEQTDSAVSPAGEAGANKVQSRLNRIKK